MVSANLTIIISYYKSPENLKVILNDLARQSYPYFEVIISEDDNNPDTRVFLNEHSEAYPFTIHHLYQKEDIGFRKNMMLNRSILKANTDKLIFIDGDCTPHRHFAKEYAQRMKKGYYYSGRAVMLSESLSQYVKKKESMASVNLFDIWYYRSKRIKEGIYFPYFTLTIKPKGRGLVGRNWGVYKSHLVDINGFDMDYTKAAVGEDVDVEWRLRQSGIKSASIKNKAIVYHLHHQRNNREQDVHHNLQLLNEKKALNRIGCLNGIQSLT